MAKTAIISGAQTTAISRGDDPPVPPGVRASARTGAGGECPCWCGGGGVGWCLCWRAEGGCWRGQSRLRPFRSMSLILYGAGYSEVMDRLAEYRGKRDAGRTPEPVPPDSPGPAGAGDQGAGIFVV